MVTCFIIGSLHTVKELSVYIGNLSLNLKGFASSFEESFKVIQMSRPDIVYIDAESTGLGFPEWSLLNNISSLVMLSNNSTGAYLAFEQLAFDYLVRPFTYSRFAAGLNKYLNIVKRSFPDESEKTVFLVKTGNKGLKETMIKYNELVFVEAMQNYVLLHLENGNYHVVYFTMKEMEANLPSTLFTRVHKSFIINNNKITSIEGNIIHINEGQKALIGNTYKRAFQEKINKLKIKGRG
eukprot:gene13090-15397_t